MKKEATFRKFLNQTLLKEWDPIGIAKVPECSDEYESYEDGIAKMIMGSKGISKIAEHLNDIVFLNIGLSGSEESKKNNIRTATILVKKWKSLERKKHAVRQISQKGDKVERVPRR